MKTLLILIIITLGCLNVFGQSKISMFQIIQKPIETISTDSLNWTDSTLNISNTVNSFYGDSIGLSAIIVVFDTNMTHSIHYSIGSNLDSSVVISDSLYFQNIPQIKMDNQVVYRKGRVLYFDWGHFLKPTDIQAQCFIKNSVGQKGEIKYFD